MKPVRYTAAYFFKPLVKGGPALSYHSGRLKITRRAPCRTHSSEFAEVFWVESGRGIHLINGQQHPLMPGTLVMIRSTDCHGLRAVDAAGLTIFWVSFPCATLETFRQRHFPGIAAYFWASTAQPFTSQLEAATLEWLTMWAAELGSYWTDPFIADRFLAELLNRLQSKSPAAPTAPAWLQQALTAIREPRQFQGGTPAFARLAGRSADHVNRALKHYCGLTTTAVVNRARMEHAARELRSGEKKLIDICLECGFQNPSHFHKVFRHQFGTTPHQYHQQFNQRSVSDTLNERSANPVSPLPVQASQTGQ